MMTYEESQKENVFLYPLYDDDVYDKLMSYFKGLFVLSEQIIVIVLIVSGKSESSQILNNSNILQSHFYKIIKTGRSFPDLSPPSQKFDVN